MSQTMTAELTQEDARRARILEGATAVFLSYGFQRTTMEDIARAAEVSRPALYLLFRNKTDIYRALAGEFLKKFLAEAETAIAGEGSLAARLERAVECSLCEMRQIEEFPHGAEILDMRSSLAADIVADGRGRMQAIFEKAIAAEAARRGRADADPALLAGLALDALDGLHMRNPPLAEQQETARRYIRAILGELGS